jgi:hypothetical protein
MEAKQVKGLMEAYASVYANISESHFKVGDEVICKASGMEGEVIKLDKPDGEDDEKYYTVKREDGKTMKYAPNDLKLAKKEKEEKEEKEDVKEAKNGGISGSSETKFHKKLDSLVHHTFGKRKEEKAMKEETDEGGKHKEGKHPKGKEEPGEKVTEKEGKEKEGKEKEMKESADLFDYILEHLVAEGYADTNKAALAIMANMSEEWKKSIIEQTARIDYTQDKFNRQNAEKSGSGLTYIPGKQNAGQALQKAKESARQMGKLEGA